MLHKIHEHAGEGQGYYSLEPFLTRLRLENIKRCRRWHGDAGVNSWLPEQWSNAAAGEMGEVCNAVKKLCRLTQKSPHAGNNNPESIEEATAAIASEIGDTIVYLDLLAARLGIDLEESIKNTFNRVSKREGFPERI